MLVQATSRPQVEHSGDPQADTKAVPVRTLSDLRRSRHNPQDVHQADSLHVEMDSGPAQLRLPETIRANAIVNELTAAELVAALSAADAPIKAGASDEEIRNLAVLGLVRLGMGHVRDLNASYGPGWSVVRVKQTHLGDTPESRAQVSELMRRLMAERSMSLTQLSKTIFYDKGYLSRVMNGLKPLSPKVAALLDEALGADGAFVALASGLPVSPAPQPSGTLHAVPAEPVQPNPDGGMILLKRLLREKHWQTYRIFCREYDKAAKTIDPSLVGTYPSRAQLHRWLAGELKRLPYGDHCEVLEAMFPGFHASDLFAEATAGADTRDSTPVSCR